MADTTNKPTHDVCFVKDRGENQKGHWTTIGAAWSHKDGKGLTLKLDALPIDPSSGDIVVVVFSRKR